MKCQGKERKCSGEGKNRVFKNTWKRIMDEIVCMSQADNIILNYPEHKIQKNKVNLHYYHAEWHDGIESNLGDYLSEVIVQWMCDKERLQYDKFIKKTSHLYALGSILQMGYQNATIWGTGFAFELSRIRTILHKHKKLDIRCVRGPRTRDTLRRIGFDCPKTYGDPAVLMPLIYEPKEYHHKEYLIIPHFSEEESARRKYGDEHILSMGTKDYMGVIDCICASDKVISSSLHGIILAEAYGIPAVFYQDRGERFNYKYMDYYESTGRKNIIPYNEITEALKAESKALNKNIIMKMQDVLIRAFPKDLWIGDN